MQALIGPLFFLGGIAALFLYLWRSAKEHERIETTRIQQLKEEKARRDADYSSHHRHKEMTASVPPPPHTVATPRKAAPGPAPVRRSTPIQRMAPTPTAAPTPAPQAIRQSDDDSYSNLVPALAGAALGFAFEHLRNSDDRPASCSNDNPIVSGNGGDFGGGGASASWDDDTPSINDDNNE